jgi:hypothetical protein
MTRQVRLLSWCFGREDEFEWLDAEASGLCGTFKRVLI